MHSINKMTAFCGLPCHECEAFLATKNSNDQKIKEVAQLWSKQQNTDYKPQDIECDGCRLKNARLHSYCKQCQVRKCALTKDITTCADCDSYICEILEDFFKITPHTKEILDKMRNAC